MGMSNISNKEAVEELLMLKRTVKANSDADKALDKAIEQLRLSNGKSLKESDEVIQPTENHGMENKITHP